MPVATLIPAHPAVTAAQLANCPLTFWMIFGSPVSGTSSSRRLRRAGGDPGGAAGQRGGLLAARQGVAEPALQRPQDVRYDCPAALLPR